MNPVTPCYYAEEHTEFIKDGISYFDIGNASSLCRSVFKEMVYLCLKELTKDNPSLPRDVGELRAMCYTPGEFESNLPSLLDLAAHWSNDLSDLFKREVLRSDSNIFERTPTVRVSRDKDDPTGYDFIYSWLVTKGYTFANQRTNLNMNTF